MSVIFIKPRKSTLNIHWKDWCWSWSSNTLAKWCEELTHWKRPCCWERLKAKEGTTKDEMVGWHHWISGHEFEQTLGDSEGQGSLACCSPCGLRVRHNSETERHACMYLMDIPRTTGLEDVRFKWRISLWQINTLNNNLNLWLTTLDHWCLKPSIKTIPRLW